ncbi:MAG: metal ABC transporter permease [Planctomycetales bacterium]|nr:metal ABC transporter permease [Planctomycetales bacterium]
MMLDALTPKVALGASLLGGAAGVVGALAVLRKRSLMGDVLAHASLPGICLAYLLFNTRQLAVLSAGALFTGMLAVLLIAGITRWTRTREDAAMGLALSVFFGAGVVLLTVIQQQARGNQAGLATYLFGEIAALRSRDVVLLAAVAAVLLTLVVAFYKELKTLSFDSQFAQSQGWPTFTLDVALMSGVAVVTVVGLPVCGVILMAAMLILPCVAARFWSNRFGMVLVLSGLIGLTTAVAGVLSAAPGEGLAWLPIRSLTLGMPPGPLIVLSGAGAFVVSALFAPERGMVARTLRLVRMRTRIATDHVLRLLFEAAEGKPQQDAYGSLSAITGRMSASRLTKWLVVWQAKRGGLLEVDGDRARLTGTGLTAAARLVRTHRLWELFLVQHADIAADHVHRSADDIEHMLPADLVDNLEDILRAEGRLPEVVGEPAVPTSPHVITKSPPALPGRG